MVFGNFFSRIGNKMMLSYSDMRRFDDKIDSLLAGNTAVLNNQALLLQRMGEIMDALNDLKQNMTDLRGLAQQYLALIIAKDDAAAALQETINGLIAAADIAQAEKDALLEGINQAVVDSQAVEDEMRAGLPGVPPVGGTPLNVSYADQASFDTAVAEYTGPEAVTLDGNEVRAGTSPSLDYFSHSADGSINTSGPTD